MILILILAFLLRFFSLNQSLWLDEATSALTTKMNLTDFFGKFLPGDFHPPLYYLVLRVCASFFGTSEIALRSLSIIFGIGTIYLIYLIGKKLVSCEVGIVSAILLATSGLHIYYSQEARMYSMSTFLVTLLIFSFTCLTSQKEKRTKIWWGIFTITLGLIGLTDYLPLLILIPIWIYVLLTKRDLYFWKIFIVSHIILLFFAVIWSPTFIKQLTAGINVTSSSPSWVNVLGKFSLKDILLIPVKFMIGRIGFDSKFIYISVVGFASAVFSFLIYRSLKDFKKLKLIYLWVLIPLGLALVISIKLPVLNYFRFLFVLPAFYLTIASGINSLNKKPKMFFLVLILTINLITSFIYLTNQKFQREDWKSAVSYVEKNRHSNSVVIFPANSQMEVYRYYAPKALIYGPSAIGKDYSELWLVRYAQAISDPADTTRAKVESLRYKKINELDFNGVVVWRYTR